jgi:hypothetical protein
LAGASDCEQANHVLRRFLPRHNRRFVVSAQEPEPVWVEWPKRQSLDEIFCFKYRRVVLNDNTVRIGRQVIDIPPPLSRAHARVDVHERFDGSFAVYLDSQCIAKKVLAQPGTVYRTRRKSDTPEQAPALRPPAQPRLPTGPWRPPSNHPWRRNTAATAKVKAS